MNYKDEVKAISATLQTALEMVAEEHGHSVQIKGGTFDPSDGTFTPRITFIKKGENGEIETPELKDLRRYHPEAEGTVINWSGEAYTIIGYKPRSPKWSVVAKRVSDGQVYKLPQEAIDRAAA